MNNDINFLGQNILFSSFFKKRGIIISRQKKGDVYISNKPLYEDGCKKICLSHDEFEIVLKEIENFSEVLFISLEDSGDFQRSFGDIRIIRRSSTIYLSPSGILGERNKNEIKISKEVLFNLIKNIKNKNIY